MNPSLLGIVQGRERRGDGCRVYYRVDQSLNACSISNCHQSLSQCEHLLNDRKECLMKKTHKTCHAKSHGDYTDILVIIIKYY